MKYIVPIVVGLLALPASGYAQSDAETIERALLAAPARARDATMVIAWNPDHTYEVLREGTNRLVCYDRSGGVQAPFAMQCTSMANLDRVAQNRRFEAEGGDRQGAQALVAAAEEDGTRVQPEFGSVFRSLSGQDQATARLHTTIAVPGATADSIGLPDNPREGGAWVMEAGSSSAHIMIPGL